MAASFAAPRLSTRSLGCKNEEVSKDVRQGFVVAVAITSLSGQLANAASTMVDITPNNISKQALTVRVETEANADGTIRFDVLVAPGRDTISPRREGRLEILRDKIARQEPGKNLPFQPPVLWCSVREVSEGDTLTYTFGLPRELLPRAHFQFRNYEPRGMPSMDVLRVLLEDFVARR